MKTRTFFRVIAPDHYANTDCETLEKAQKVVNHYRENNSPEYAEYWNSIADKCRIVKITEITEEL